MINFIIEPLTHIVNLILKMGIFPDKFKIAKVLPVHKSGDKYSMNNYRPIYLMSNLAKVTEKVI